MTLECVPAYLTFLDCEDVWFRFDKVTQFLEPVKARIEIGLQFGQIAAECSQIGPAAVITGLIKGLQDELEG